MVMFERQTMQFKPVVGGCSSDMKQGNIIGVAGWI